VKTFARLAVLILLSPALLLAQTSTGQATTGSKAGDTKPSYAQTAPADGQESATTPGSPQAGQKPAATTSETAKPSVPLAYPVMSAKAKDRARQVYEYFARGESAQFYASFTPDMKKQSQEGKISTMSKQVTEKLGTPGEVLSENFLPSPGSPVTLYTRTSKYSKAKVPILIMLGINGDGNLTDFQIQPIPPTPRDEYADYQDSTKLHLPFKDSWTVLQGGRTLYDNGNAASDDNRYTVSFMFTKDGTAFENTGKKNSDFYCYGQPVLAPASGVVVQSASNAADHPPGKGPDFQSRGNYVVIAHGNSEFSMIPYLKAGSLKVRNGQRVKQGDVIGECGDSGSSMFPHVEYSLQNSRGFPLPKTMPAQFVDYTADGKPVPMGEPLRGEAVANQSKTAPVETAGKP
jgi:murein DD-endopeptidase MepM/ murein hydrolase activator NlpD